MSIIKDLGILCAIVADKVYKDKPLSDITNYKATSILDDQYYQHLIAHNHKLEQGDIIEALDKLIGNKYIAHDYYIYDGILIDYYTPLNKLIAYYIK